MISSLLGFCASGGREKCIDTNTKRCPEKIEEQRRLWKKIGMRHLHTQGERVWRCWKKRTPVDRCFMCNKDASSSLLGFYGCVKAWKTIVALLLVFQIVLQIHIYIDTVFENLKKCLTKSAKLQFSFLFQNETFSRDFQILWQQTIIHILADVFIGFKVLFA